MSLEHPEVETGRSPAGDVVVFCRHCHRQSQVEREAFQQPFCAASHKDFLLHGTSSRGALEDWEPGGCAVDSKTPSHFQRRGVTDVTVRDKVADRILPVIIPHLWAERKLH